MYSDCDLKGWCLIIIMMSGVSHAANAQQQWDHFSPAPHLQPKIADYTLPFVSVFLLMYLVIP